ncbi:hypothetical protein HUX88_07610 [Duganella sp. BJB1802]|uniref:hypothetical protein n=1 Tax=Duganella sp. BJB1802 TaxID=2744575 RepID=UPI0015933F27|nr:hypothetical protein [Duganella sp. BJB1802]NVD70426.1 hypothetical protein [Duganella sp. BJB1802]
MKKISLALVLAAALSACSPQYDWRDYRSSDAPYAVLFPGKPASQTRSIQLDTLAVNMTMTAAEVNGVIFAVGSAQLPDAAQGPAAIEAMKTALVNNIGATVTSNKSSADGRQATLDVEAKGSQNGETMRLIGHFVAKDKRIYQVIVMGRDKNIVQDTVETYLSSFKLN